MDEVDEWIQELLDDGCFTEHGEEYKVNWPLLEVLHPTVYEVMWEDNLRETDEALRNLCDMGLLQMSFQIDEQTGKMEPVYSLTDAGKAYTAAAASGGNFPPEA